MCICGQFPQKEEPTSLPSFTKRRHFRLFSMRLRRRALEIWTRWKVGVPFGCIHMALHDTFISYASEDNDFASEVAYGLKTMG